MILLDISRQVSEIFGSETDHLTPLQMGLRAVVVFILAIAILRISGIRSLGNKSAFDVVLSITIGAVLSRCITGQYDFFACLLAAVALALLHRVFAIGAFFSKGFNKMVNGEAHVIYRNNRIRWSEMKKHSITKEDLIHAVHRECLSSLDEIEEAYFETDGKITVVKKKAA